MQLPAHQLAALAARSDVAGISPNCTVMRCASLLQSASGSSTGNVRSCSTSASGLVSYSGLDGAGVGIEVLDSSVMRAHRSFRNAAGQSRVLRNVNMRNANLADWLGGVDSTLSPAPGSAALAATKRPSPPTSTPPPTTPTATARMWR